MELDLASNSSDSRLISRMKLSLREKFRPNREADIEKAVQLANYMVALDRLAEAKAFLKSFVYLQVAKRPLELWHANAQGLLLLAHIANQSGDNSNYEQYISILAEDDLWPADIARWNWIRMHLADHEKNVQHALSETAKHRCAFLGQEVLSFMYFRECLYVYGRPNPIEKWFERRVLSTLNHSRTLLVQALQEVK